METCKRYKGAAKLLMDDDDSGLETCDSSGPSGANTSRLLAKAAPLTCMSVPSM